MTCRSSFVAVTVGLIYASLVGCSVREPAFVGKTVVISSKSESNFGVVLEAVQVTSFGGESFLVGAAADDGQPDNWIKGQTVWIPLNDVAQVVEFPDFEAYKRTQKVSETP